MSFSQKIIQKKRHFYGGRCEIPSPTTYIITYKKANVNIILSHSKQIFLFRKAGETTWRESARKEWGLNENCRPFYPNLLKNGKQRINLCFRKIYDFVLIFETLSCMICLQNMGCRLIREKCTNCRRQCLTGIL